MAYDGNKLYQGKEISRILNGKSQKYFISQEDEAHHAPEYIGYIVNGKGEDGKDYKFFIKLREEKEDDIKEEISALLSNGENIENAYLPYAIEEIKEKETNFLCVVLPRYIDKLSEFMSKSKPTEIEILEYFRQICYAVKNYSNNPSAPVLIIESNNINVFSYDETKLKQIAPDYPIKYLLVFKRLGYVDQSIKSSSSFSGGARLVHNREQYTYNLGTLLYEMLSSLQGKVSNFTMEILANCLSSKEQRWDIHTLCFYLGIDNLYKNFRSIEFQMDIYAPILQNRNSQRAKNVKTMVTNVQQFNHISNPLSVRKNNVKLEINRVVDPLNKRTSVSQKLAVTPSKSRTSMSRKLVVNHSNSESWVVLVALLILAVAYLLFKMF